MTLRDTLSMGKNEVIINYASQSNNDKEIICSCRDFGLTDKKLVLEPVDWQEDSNSYLLTHLIV
jgi:hypothetical protein